MPRAAAATQFIAQLCRGNTGQPGHAMGVHFFNGWGKQQMAARLQEFFLIGGQRARVSIQVFVGTELQRVDENARHYKVRLLSGGGD